MNISMLRRLPALLARLRVVMIALLLLGAAYSVESEAWAAATPNHMQQSVPVFNFHLDLPVIANHPLPVNISNREARNYHPTWSPDSQKIAFVGTVAGDDAGDSEIYVVNADGSNLKQLTGGLLQSLLPPDELWFASAPDWSPDGKQIAFAMINCGSDACRGGGLVRSYVMKSDGSDPQHIGGGLSPIWSPDGAKLLFQYPSSYTVSVPAWGVMHADGTHQTVLVSEAIAPVWSPDSSKVAFTHGPLLMIDVDGSNLTLLEPEGSLSHSPAWSPDGQEIAYAANKAGSWQLRLVSVAEGIPVALGDETWQRIEALAWLPDGERLIFWGDDPGGSGTGFFVIQRNGTNLRLHQAFTPASPFFSMTWSPDKTQVAFSLDTDQLYTLRVPGAR